MAMVDRPESVVEISELDHTRDHRHAHHATECGSDCFLGGDTRVTRGPATCGGIGQRRHQRPLDRRLQSLLQTSAPLPPSLQPVGEARRNRPRSSAPRYSKRGITSRHAVKVGAVAGLGMNGVGTRYVADMRPMEHGSGGLQHQRG
jgi:hypothetical protein